MKRKALIIVGCAIAFIVVSWLGVSWLATTLFGERVETICSNRVIDSIQIGDRPTTVSVEDGLCDAGLVVSGAYKIVLRYPDHDQVIEKVLLTANNMRSDASPPQIRALSPNNVLITGRKATLFKSGPSEVAGIHLTYEIK
jgi:hypothetical protein